MVSASIHQGVARQVALVGHRGVVCVVAGHEPCGEVVGLGAGTRRGLRDVRRVSPRLCGRCHPLFRAAYGWQRDGGHADYLLAEVTSLHHIPSSSSRTWSVWRVHPEQIVTHRLPLAEASAAYRIADEGQAGKVCLTWD